MPCKWAVCDTKNILKYFVPIESKRGGHETEASAEKMS